jgi:hypothetical protein
MAQFNIAVGSGIVCYVNYNANNGRASALTTENSTNRTWWSRVTMADGRVFQQLFPPGTTNLNFPANVVSVVPDPDTPGDMMVVGVNTIESAFRETLP